ncbi:MAG: hypothetical protein Q8S11_01645 [Daejeonella sp.]|uniref:hypothetical protein n=1 Tax=Daejeonella sp. TaxID=2805397 RepID=UPI0027341B01|nr:hypothetical protein [Daejeonella sp.]MDP3467005.1 hypothetical protein [Daejeonella sp.]
MNKLIRLIKYHILLLAAFSSLVISAFYISEGGNISTPLAVALYYLISAALLYIPLILILTCFNFVIIAIGLRTLKNFKNQVAICFLPVLLFSLWFIFSQSSSFESYWKLSDFQFYIITGIWIILLLTGMIIYSGLRKYTLAALLPAMVFTLLFFLQKYNISSRQLSISNFNFSIMLVIWIVLNYCLLHRYRKMIYYLERKVAIEPVEEV